IVSDSYDIFNACSNIFGEQLKDKVMARDGVLVIRPDSGDPTEVVSKIIEILGDKFGYSINEKGYKVLDPHVKIIQGDGVDYNAIQSILWTLAQNGWASSNLVFGSDGSLLQKMD